jgi:large subunit ribosomal protein L13
MTFELSPMPVRAHCGSSAAPLACAALAWPISSLCIVSRIRRLRTSCANGEGACVPDRVQDAGMRIELLQTPLAPGQVIAFLGGGLQQIFPRCSRTGHQSLAMIKSLGGDLARVVDPHQPGHVAAVRFGQVGGFGQFRWVTAGGGRDKQRPQGVIGGLQQGLDRPGRLFCKAQGASVHFRAIFPEAQEAPRVIRRPARSGSVWSLPHIMKTTFANSATVRGDWYVVDATGKTLGRLASQIAHRLKGKHKADYSPHVNMGDHIVVLHAEKIAVTGNKLDDKMYHHHTGYMGNLKSIALGKLLKEHPERALQFAIKGMLPKNTLGRNMYRKLHVFAGGEHPHSAQQPKQLAL